MTSLSEIYASINSFVQALNNQTKNVTTALTTAASTGNQVTLSFTSSAFSGVFPINSSQIVSIGSTQINDQIGSSQISGTFGTSQISNMGGWTLLQTILSSNAGGTGSSFAIPAGYQTYMVLGQNIFVGGAASPLVTLGSTNGGTSYNNTNYGSVGFAQSSAATTLFNSTTTWGMTTNNVSTIATNGGASFRFLLWGSGTIAGSHSQLNGDIVATSASTAAIAGTYAGTYLGGIVNAIRIQPSNGSSFQNGGVISLYGAVS